VKGTRRRLLSLVAAIVLMCVTAFGSTVAQAATVISVNGTRPSEHFWPGAGLPDDTDRVMRGYFVDYEVKIVIDYIRTAGILTNLEDEGYDISVDEGTRKTVEAIKQVRTEDPDGHIDVIGQSQGADAVSRAIKILEAEGYDTSNITFWVIGNVDNPDGGLLTRFSFLNGVYIPLIGITYGKGRTTESQYSRIIQVVNEYDGAADLPDYLLYPASWLALANAMLGGFVYDRHVYHNADPSDANNIVWVSEDGLRTNILVPNPEGELPILKPLTAMGASEDVTLALEPFVRTLVDAGYNRADLTTGLQLLPGPDKLVRDVISIIEGFTETMKRLDALARQKAAERLNPTPEPSPNEDREPIENQSSVMQSGMSLLSDFRQRSVPQRAMSPSPDSTSESSGKTNLSEKNSEPNNTHKRSRVAASGEQQKSEPRFAEGSRESEDTEIGEELSDGEDTPKESVRSSKRNLPKFTPSGKSWRKKSESNGIRILMDRVQETIKPNETSSSQRESQKVTVPSSESGPSAGNSDNDKQNNDQKSE